MWLLEISVPPLLEGTGLVFFALGIWLQKRNVNLLTPPRWLRPGGWR
ncbi:hypothetical protein [Hymenobacter cellulosilyticus]|uniref:Uncharacterized protein n=1 Tax=Hymenobacter cellulosilyticus TaxID=2932248 RepID=A0A8T9Q9B4_9BACT|nr:hypothetical protein [Hymenobacter cellulosilyticus]UOQ72991.1 hypothetical protein MUN79_03145 [Hymenobacter cellulosilyticus]